MLNNRAEPEERERYDLRARIDQLKNTLVDEKIDFLLSIYLSLQKFFEGNDAEVKKFEDVNSRLDAIEERLVSIERTIRQKIAEEFQSLMVGLRSGIVEKIEEIKREDVSEFEQKLEELKSLIISSRANEIRRLEAEMESATEVFQLNRSTDDEDDYTDF